MQKLFYFICFVILFQFSSCCILKKQKIKTETITVTVTKIDTVVKIINHNTVYRDSVYFRDTLRIETKYNVIKTYIDTSTKQLKGQVTGKDFDVPVTMNQVKTEETKVKQVETKPKSNYIVLFLLGIILGILIVTKTLKK